MTNAEHMATAAAECTLAESRGWKPEKDRGRPGFGYSQFRRGEELIFFSPNGWSRATIAKDSRLVNRTFHKSLLEALGHDRGNDVLHASAVG